MNEVVIYNKDTEKDKDPFTNEEKEDIRLIVQQFQSIIGPKELTVYILFKDDLGGDLMNCYVNSGQSHATISINSKEGVPTYRYYLDFFKRTIIHELIHAQMFQLQHIINEHVSQYLPKNQLDMFRSYYQHAEESMVDRLAVNLLPPMDHYNNKLNEPATQNCLKGEFNKDDAKKST